VVEALNNVGIPGVGLVLASLASTGFRIAALVRRNRSGLAADAGQLAALFILVLTTSLVESSFAGRANSYGFAYWALAAACYAQPDPGVRPREHEEGGVET
jgi:O-antigen ligase